MFSVNQVDDVTIKANDVESQIMLFMSQLAENNIAIHCVSIYHAGQTIFEKSVEPYRSDEPHMSFSLSKGLIATAIGLLIDEGRITLDMQLSDYFQDYKHITELNHMTLHDALTMCTGHSRAMFGSDFRTVSGHWLDEFLSIPYSEEAGKAILYNSGTSYLLSILIERIAGMPVDEYLQQKLFDPMKLGKLEWERSPQGSNTGGWGVNITSAQMLSISALYLNKGVWNGEQLLSEEWIERATTIQMAVEEEKSTPYLRGFGYHFWCADEEVFFSEGACGQLCLVDRQSESIIMIYGGHSKLPEQRELVCKTLLPTLRASYALHGGYENTKDLSLSTLYSYKEVDAPKHHIEKQLKGHYIVTDLSMVEDYDAISFQCNSQQGELVLFKGQESYNIAFGLPDYCHSTTTFSTKLHDNYEWQSSKISAIAIWINDKTLRIICRYINKVYVDCFELTFEENRLSIERSVNVGNIAQTKERYVAVSTRSR